MDMVGKLKKFVRFVRHKYEANETFRSYGEYPWPLIDESGIDFRGAKAQLAAIMDVLLKHGFIEVVNGKQARHITSHTKIKPTLRGLESKREDWSRIVSAVTEGITEGIVKELTK